MHTMDGTKSNEQPQWKVCSWMKASDIDEIDQNCSPSQLCMQLQVMDVKELKYSHHQQT